ncbi:hypothetical protein DXV76_00495 [Rhodobacteraceae bacterium CCMM004]|nr:hypothetical protein DXV76_00495 [Rhodobacteraceae bacterium CCMM004]
MDWTRAIDAYCERTDPSYWSEPVNAVTNAAFLIAALWMWPRARRHGPWEAMALCVVLAVIGVGSYLFHTHATAWSAMLDVLPILIFILLYTYAANRRYWRLPVGVSALGAAAVVPYAIGLGAVFAALPFFEVSAQYWPIPLLIAGYGVALRGRLPTVARGLVIGAGILVASLIFRSVDETLCTAIPVGTHFMWHVLNGVMLGWMIAVLVRHRVEAGRAGG